MYHVPEGTGNVFNVCDVANDILGKDNIKYIFEFGSRYGEDTIQFAKIYPDATIWGFECNPKTKEKCSEKLKEFNNVIFSDCAISDELGTATFFSIDEKRTETTWIDGNQGASSLFQASGKYPVEKYVQNPTVVKTTTLKQVMSEQQIPRIDIMWMDIQGAELMALRGLEEKISNVSIIFTEVEFFEIYKEQPLFGQISNFLCEKGFRFCGFLNKGEYAGDALFVNLKHPNSAKCDYLRYGFSLPPAPCSLVERCLKKVKRIFKNIF